MLACLPLASSPSCLATSPGRWPGLTTTRVSPFSPSCSPTGYGSSLSRLGPSTGQLGLHSPTSTWWVLIQQRATECDEVLFEREIRYVFFFKVSAWGGYVFIINLIPLHVFVLLLMNRYSQRIYVAYNTFFIIGLLCSMQIPFVGFQPVKTSEHMASAGKSMYSVLHFLHWMFKMWQDIH